MVRVSPPSLSASSGELSELMYARRDFTRFQNGARASRGFIPLPEGPATRLPGTRFMGFTHGDGAQDARIMAFVFRDEDAILLEWTANLLRFWRQGALILSGAAPYTIGTPYTLAQARRLQSLQSADRIYLTEGDLPPQTLSRFGLTNWAISATSFTGGPFADRNIDDTKQVRVSGTTGAITLTATSAIFGAHHVGTLFQLVETDKDNTPYWTADVTVRIGDQVYYDGHCYQVVAFDGSRGTTGGSFPTSWGSSENPQDPPATYPNGQVIWTLITYSDAYQEWEPSVSVRLGDRRNRGEYSWEVTGFTTGTQRSSGVNAPTHTEGDWLSEAGGPVWRYLHSGSGIVRITAVADDTHASGTVVGRIPSGLVATYTHRWAEQAWSTVAGWPRAIGAFGQRHIYGGTPTEPRRLWHGVINGTTDMTSGPNDDDGFSYALSASRKRQGRIRAITEGPDELFILTEADEIVGTATDADRAFARETAKYTIVSENGCADTLPEMVDGLPVYLSKDASRLLYEQVEQATGRLKAENLTAISRHILGGQAIKLVRQISPLPLLWILLKGGELACCTFEPGQQVVGFSRHNLGGVVTDMEILPSDDGTSQDLWLVVRRRLRGEDFHCIERLEKPFIDLDGVTPVLADAWHQMCARRWTGAEATVIPGFSHLAGERVTAWTDLGAFTDLPVSGDGTVTLPQAVTSAIVGIDVTDQQRFDTLDVVIGQPDGGDDGRLRTHRVSGIRVHRSAGGTFEVIQQSDAADPSSTGAEPLFPRWGDPFGPPVLRDGVVEMPGHKGWAHQTWLRIRPEPGAPLTMAARTPTLMITDD